MSSKFKKILFLVINLFLYFVPSLIFRGDNGYYKTLNKAFVPPIVFMIVWPILFIILSGVNTYFFSHKEKYNHKDFRMFFILTIINYIFIFLYPLGFFVLKSLFLNYIFTLLTCVTAILITIESLLLNKKVSLLYIPYILWTIFASIYSIILYLNN
jgi:tryptophan-rich sensory protein